MNAPVGMLEALLAAQETAAATAFAALRGFWRRRRVSSPIEGG